MSESAGSAVGLPGLGGSLNLHPELTSLTLKGSNVKSHWSAGWQVLPLTCGRIQVPTGDQSGVQGAPLSQAFA